MDISVKLWSRAWTSSTLGMWGGGEEEREDKSVRMRGWEEKGRKRESEEEKEKGKGGETEREEEGREREKGGRRRKRHKQSSQIIGVERSRLVSSIHWYTE